MIINERSIFSVTVLSLTLLLATCASARAQGTKICETDFPCVPGYAGRVIHDAGHAVTAVTVAEGLRIFDSDWNRTDRYLLATVALPLLQETFDYTVFHLLEGKGFDRPPGRESVNDLLTYQGAWTVHLWKEGKHWQAILVFVAWGSAVAVWNLER